MRRPRPRLAVAGLAVALAACAGILGLRAPAPRAFEHRKHVLAGIGCLECHAGVAEAGDTDPLHLPASVDCQRCHPKPHDPRPCLGCHTDPSAAPGAAAARRHLTFAHATHVPRASTGCVRCHADVAQDGKLLRPPMATCFSCHEHGDQWEARACDACHVDLIEEGTLPASHLVHDGDWAREHGTRAAGQADLCATCHADRFCGGCHGATVAALPARRSFDTPDGASVHRGGFAARHADEAKGDPGLCTTCHREDFCGGCHADRGVGAGAVVAGSPGVAVSPHPPGWVSLRGEDNAHGRAARRDPAQCAACHGGAGEMLCVGCHKVGAVGGNPHPPGWSSTKRLSERPCRLCHTGSP